MSKLFREYYLTESAKDYKYKLKFAVNDFTGDQKDCLEKALAKFDLRSVGKYSDTPIQKHPLDFPNVRNTKVHIVEVVLGYPTTVDELRVFLCDKVGVNQQSIAVYNENDPRDGYTEEAIKIRANEKDANYVPALGSEYPVEEKPAYGKTYNDKFLKELNDAKSERRVDTVENPLMPKAKFDTKEVKDVGEAGGDSVLGGKNGPIKTAAKNRK